MESKFNQLMKITSEKSKEFISNYNKELLEYLEVNGIEALKERLRRDIVQTKKVS